MSRKKNNQLSFYNEDIFKKIIFYQTLYGIKIKFFLGYQNQKLSPNDILKKIKEDIGCGRLLMNSTYNKDNYYDKKRIIICRIFGHHRALEKIVLIKMKSEDDLIKKIDHWFINIIKSLIHKIKEYLNSWG